MTSRIPTRLKATAVTLLSLAVLTGVAGCDAGSTGSAPAPPARSAGDVFTADQIQPLVDGVAHRTVKPLPATRLAPGLVPPTNRWFSGLVFSDQPQPVFPLPLSFGLTEHGFAFGLPTVTATEKNIAGGYKPDVSVDTGAVGAQITAYDTTTVTIAGLDQAGQVLGRTTIAQGSPFVSYTTESGSTLSSAVAFTAEADHWTAQVGGVSYGLVLDQGSISGSEITLEDGGSATWFVVPADGSAGALAELAKNRLTGSSMAYALEDATARTTLRYATTSGPTAVALMPHQTRGLIPEAECGLGTYPSIYGTLKLCSGTEFTYSTPVTEPTGTLDLGQLSSSDKKTLLAQVKADVARTPAFPADTYFGGKALYRAAMLYSLADQLEAAEIAAKIRTTLVDQLLMWTDPQGCAKREAFCFVYDEAAHGLVGLTPSFGSEEFNDHHFHYGYFLYAAGVVAADDPALAAQLAPVMNLLAADIGSTATNGSFPDRRVFDVYAGHSWASGTSPFADGNNQESSSEAATAWTGLALWGQASGNAPLTREATWMLSTEAAAGLAYWTNFDRADPVYTGFGHQVMPLNWGGKRDYATWFSPEPAALLGILVIPMSPASTYLGADPARVNVNVSEATGGRFDQKFGDYLLMYSALAGKSERTRALAEALELDEKWIDDGNSRAYLLAWLMSVQSG